MDLIRRYAAVLIVLLSVLAMTVASALSLQGYVKTKTALKIRESASTSGKQISSIANGITVPYYKVQTTKGTKWYYIKYRDQYGWVCGTYVKSAITGTTATSSATKTKGYVQTTANVNLRDAAAKTGKRLATVPKGTRMAYDQTAKGSGGTWYHVTYSGRKGWILGSYLKQVNSVTQTTQNVSNGARSITLRDGSKRMTLYPAEKIDWYKGGIQSLIKRGSTFQIYDVKTGHIWKAYRQAGGDHMDIEPYTAADTKTLCEIYGVSTAAQIKSKNLWQRRPCLVTVNGHTYACSLYGIPHGDDTIAGNNMQGQICLHFTNSKTHSSNKVDSYHKAAIENAWQNCPAGHK